MTDLVQNLKIGNTTYAIQDGNTLPALTAAQRTTLLSNGTYLGKAVASGVKFETDSGKFESFTDTVSPPTFTTTEYTNDYYLNDMLLASDGSSFVGIRGDNFNPGHRSTSGTGSWTSFTFPGVVFGISYLNDRYLAFARGWLSGGSNVYQSFDGGSTWSSFASPWGKYGSYSAAYGNGIYLLLGDCTYGTGAACYSKVAYSTDSCATWTSVSLPSQGSWTSVAYGNGVFVAVSGSNKAAYSSNGANWTGFEMPSAGWSKIIFGNGVFVVFRSGSNAVAYSADGIHWTETTLPASASWKDIAYGGGVFVIIASSSSTCAYSTDGINWLSGNMPASRNWTGVAYGNGYFIAIAFQDLNYAKLSFETIHTYSLDPLSYTKSEVDTALASKQGTLTAGNGIDITSDTISAEEMVGADGVNIGKAGAVPRPAATDNTKFLRGDGTWAEAGGGGSASYDSTTQEITLG